MYKIELYSGTTPDQMFSDDEYLGCDGSFSLDHIPTRLELISYASTFDCVYGLCIAVVTSQRGNRVLIPFERKDYID